jgi:flagellar motility protein MotE (MotC chaperone)
MRLEFDFVDFIPRKDFKEKANLALKKIYDKMPCDTVCEATCTYYSHYFFFQVIFYDRDKKFEAQCILNPKKEDTRDRSWQTKAINKLEEQLDQKLQKWLDERDLGEDEKKAA